MARRIDELNALEEAEAEQVSGMPFTNLEDDDAPKVKLILALAWVHKKRSEPTLKYLDYMKAQRTRDAANYLFGDSEDPEDADEAEEADQDPFPASGADGAEPAPAGVAGAEGAVLSRDGAVAG